MATEVVVLATVVWGPSPLLTVAFVAATLGIGVALVARASGGGRGSLAVLRRAGPTRGALVLAWLGFVAAFGVLRALTFVIHTGVGLGDLHAGGIHLHHYIWGILFWRSPDSAASSRSPGRGGPGWGWRTAARSATRRRLPSKERSILFAVWTHG
ncbi:hypothetical protein [Actinoplanes sp. NPDC026619]|uniref:hypothetical protein n=1 Tax=Actinoplanes sp. NPDC026619 TaxID=3155798 RepID=UPI0033D0C57F